MKNNNATIIQKKALAVMAMLFVGAALQAQIRMIPHVTRAGGGFATDFILENYGIDTGLIVMKLYDVNGNLVSNGDMFMNAGSTLVKPSTDYGTDISHVVVEGDSWVRLSAAYRASKTSNSPAHLSENPYQSKLWRIFGSNWLLTFDGMAVVNAGAAATQVKVTQKDAAGTVLAEQVVISNLAPMAKGLYVLAAPFTQREDGWFEITADQNIAVTALRGSYPSDPVGYLWENEAVPSVAKAQPGGFSLPHFGEYDYAGYILHLVQKSNNASTARFDLNNPGGFGTALFVTSNSAAPSLFSSSWENASAAEFKTNSTQSQMPTVVIDNRSTQGSALSISNNAPSNAKAQLLVNVTTDAPGLKISQAGEGYAAEFSIDSMASGSAVKATTMGMGYGVEAIGAANASGLWAQSWGNGTALVARAEGDGVVADFMTKSESSSQNTVSILNKGKGMALDVRSTDTSSNSPVLRSKTSHYGAAIQAESEGGGYALVATATNGAEVAFIHQAYASTMAPALKVYHEGGLGKPAAEFRGDVYVQGGSYYNGPLNLTGPLGVTGPTTLSGPVTISGPVNISGNVTKSSGNFMIDHPLDPENKLLFHSFVESDQMMNLYSGKVVLDESGQAEIQLPEWFSALNAEVLYQLTPIGKPAPGLFVSRELENGLFAIAGGQPGQKVSWQLTGVRQDAYAKTHPMQVEVEKAPEKKGSYVNPSAYPNQPSGQPNN
jgi:hypothetical protein